MQQLWEAANAIRYLKDMIGPDFPHMIVKDGQTLDLGNKSLQFIGAPNLHWPDSMYTYLPEDKLLFTCDSLVAIFVMKRCLMTRWEILMMLLNIIMM